MKCVLALVALLVCVVSISGQGVGQSSMPVIPNPIIRPQQMSRPSRDFWPGPNAYPRMPSSRTNTITRSSRDPYLDMLMAMKQADLDLYPGMFYHRQVTRPRGQGGLFGSDMNMLFPLLAADVFEF